jgi:hypothetical protein
MIYLQGNGRLCQHHHAPFNEAWAARNAARLAAQNYKHWQLIVIDSGSRTVRWNCFANFSRVIEIPHSEYNPSRVMNHGT